jgi:GGDEF domain-containing protein
MFVDGVIERHSGNFAGVYVDIDDFKAYNDSAGHQAGDQEIGKVRHTLRDHVRSECEADTLFPERSGDVIIHDGIALNPTGDEFIVLAHGMTTQEDVDNLIIRIQTALESVGVRASMGGRPHQSGETAQTFLDDIDAMMRQNKDGRACRELTAERIAGLRIVDAILEKIQIPRASVAKYLRVLDQLIDEVEVEPPVQWETPQEVPLSIDEETVPLLLEDTTFLRRAA